MKFFKKNNKINPPIPPAPHEEERSMGLLTGALNFNSVSSYQSSQSMRLSAVYSAVTQISNAVASLPLYVYNTDAQGYMNVSFSHYAFSVLNRQPSRNLSRFNFFKLLISSVILKGNGYAWISRDDKGRVTSLRYLPAEYVTVMYDWQKDEIQYVVAGGGQDNIIPSYNMLHFWIYSYDTVNGISVITHAIDTLQLAKDSENHAHNFYKSGASISGILKTAAPVNEAQKAQIKASWAQAFENPNGNGMAIVPAGMDYEAISINAKDAQLLESREFSVVEIARFFNISPIKLFDLKNSSYSSLEQTQLEFLSDTINPYLIMVEQEINRKLWLPSEAINTSAHFDFSQFLKTDKKSMAEYYTQLTNYGILTPNEVRKALSYNEMENGNELMIQLNMTTLKNIINNPENQNQNNIKQKTKNII